LTLACLRKASKITCTLCPRKVLWSKGHWPFWAKSCPYLRHYPKLPNWVVLSWGVRTSSSPRTSSSQGVICISLTRVPGLRSNSSGNLQPCLFRSSYTLGQPGSFRSIAKGEKTKSSYSGFWRARGQFLWSSALNLDQIDTVAFFTLEECPYVGDDLIEAALASLIRAPGDMGCQ
jgi:hypothetical protein